jgi:hypothetical protein
MSRPPIQLSLPRRPPDVAVSPSDAAIPARGQGLAPSEADLLPSAATIPPSEADLVPSDTAVSADSVPGDSPPELRLPTMMISHPAFHRSCFLPLPLPARLSPVIFLPTIFPLMLPPGFSQARVPVPVSRVFQPSLCDPVGVRFPIARVSSFFHRWPRGRPFSWRIACSCSPRWQISLPGLSLVGNVVLC